MTTTPRGAPELVSAQAIPETTVNEQIRRTEGGAGRYPIADRVTAPPGSCVDGAQYMIIATATGAFASKEGQIAQAVGTNAASGWNYRVPGTIDEGILAYVQDEDVDYKWSGSAWSSIGAGGGSVTTVSVASANGFAGSVANATTTPAITLTTSITGLLKGNGTAISAASAGTDYYSPGGTDVALADGGTGASLTDPNADRIMFWDDSAGAVTWLTAGSGLSIAGTTITATGGSGGIGDVVGPGSATDGNLALFDGTTGKLIKDGGAPSAIKPTESFIIACSDESTAITTGTAKATFRMPYAFTVTDVRASVNTAPTGSTILIDINEGGTTILSTKLMIDASELTSTTAATPAVISDASLADDAAMSVDFDQVGSTIAGKGVKVTIIGHRT